MTWQMTVKPLHRRTLCLLGGLVLLTTIETATLETAVSTAEAVVPTQLVRKHASSTAEEGRNVVEERAPSLWAAVRTVGNQLWPLAGKLIPNIKLDELPTGYHNVKMIEFLNTKSIAEAIDILIEDFDNVNALVRTMLIWFGRKSYEDQNVAINLLAAKLKQNARTRIRLITLFETGKKVDNLFSDLAAAVEMTWLMNMSADEMCRALGFSSNLNYKEFVELVGLSIWNQFGERGNTLMLAKMQEQSRNELMWARIIYELLDHETMKGAFAGLFDDLLRSYDAAVGNCRPIEAVEFLMSPKLMEVYNDVTLTSKEAGAATHRELLQLSKDEFMWAKLIYMLQNDRSVLAIPSGVFDALLQPYDTDIYGPHQCTASQAVRYLTSSEFFQQYSNIVLTSNDFHALLLAELHEKSLDELMWAKLLYMMRNDESVFVPLSSVLETVVGSWTVAVQSALKENEEIIANSKFVNLYMYAQFLSNNPNVFVLEKLRERSSDEVMWAKVLYMLQSDNSESKFMLASVLNTLLQTWIRPVHGAAEVVEQADTPSENALFLKSPKFADLLEYAHFSSDNPYVIVLEKLRERSPDEFMWARLLSKLRQDNYEVTTMSGVLDTLLHSWIDRPYDAAVTAYKHTLIDVYETLINRVYDKRKRGKQLIGKKKVTQTVRELLQQSKNKVMWAKFLWKLQQDREISDYITRVFNALLQLHDAKQKAHLFTPMSSIQYLSDSAFYFEYASMYPSGNAEKTMLAKMLALSSNEVMWAKVLYILQSDDSKSKPKYSNLLNTLLQMWMGSAHGVAEQPYTPSENKLFLKSPKFADLFEYAHFSSDYPNVFVLEKLRERSPDEFMWARLLSKLRQENYEVTTMFGVLDNLLHSWIGRPYDAGSAIAKEHTLIYAYEDILNWTSNKRKHGQLQNYKPKVTALTTKLLKWVNDELMWAKLLFKLRQDKKLSILVINAFDALLQPYDAEDLAQLDKPSLIVNYLTSSAFIQEYALMLPNGMADEAMLVKMLDLSSNEVSWAKVLYLLQSDESESRPMFVNLLMTLLQSWIKPVDGVAEQPNTFFESALFLKSHKFADLCEYAHFSSDNPNVFVLEKLRERSPDEFMWARLLNNLRQSEGKVTSMSGVLDALLHSWIERPYVATTAEKPTPLVDGYNFLTSHAVATWYDVTKSTGKVHHDMEIRKVLLRISNDNFMWTKLLNKLHNDESARFFHNI